MAEMVNKFSNAICIQTEITSLLSEDWAKNLEQVAPDNKKNKHKGFLQTHPNKEAATHSNEEPRKVMPTCGSL